MKTERRWMKSAIKAAQTEEVLLPWAVKRSDAPTPPTPAVVYLSAPAPRALHYAIAAK